MVVLYCIVAMHVNWPAVLLQSKKPIQIVNQCNDVILAKCLCQVSFVLHSSTTKWRPQTYWRRECVFDVNSKLGFI